MLKSQSKAGGKNSHGAYKTTYILEKIARNGKVRSERVATEGSCKCLNKPDGKPTGAVIMQGLCPKPALDVVPAPSLLSSVVC